MTTKQLARLSGDTRKGSAIVLLLKKGQAKKAGSRNPGGSATALVFQRAQLK
jgi:hypothetical protein